ncbi:MAG: hypothetical protein PHW96_04610 [Candidatus Nanoarchaeia archaeon]|nr:hypothetical protein [Candidatus Nanoarchaeia archaeon]
MCDDSLENLTRRNGNYLFKGFKEKFLEQETYQRQRNDKYFIRAKYHSMTDTNHS